MSTSIATGNLLIVDDDQVLRRSMRRMLARAGFSADTAANGEEALELVRRKAYDCIVSDISMPGMDGIGLLRAVREQDLDVPVLLVTGAPSVATAVRAVEYGAFQYLEKPFDPAALTRLVAKAMQLGRMARVKREALELVGDASRLVGDRAGLEAAFGRALDALWMAFQPIVRSSDGSVFAYEALMRTTEPAIPHPGALLDAAERLDRLVELGRTVRSRAAGAIGAAPHDALLFVNLHVRDLLDDSLLTLDAPLSRIASRVVLEITERASLDTIPGAGARVAALRDLGFRIAIDDLGAGYAGLTAFASLEPEVVKLDMSLVRGVDGAPRKRKLIEAMTHLCKDMGVLVVGEGVETVGERDFLIEAGCDLLQGYLFAKPGKPFPEARWG